MGVWSVRRGLAIFSLILYCFDTGSDAFVSIDLIFFKCHVRYGLTVFAFILLPGFFFGWWRYSEDPSCKYLLRAFVFPIWYLPYSIKKLIRAVMNSTQIGETSSGDEGEAKL